MKQRRTEDTYSECDLEAAILRGLERFLLELGTDFSFIARQKCMTIGDRDFYLDLSFAARSCIFPRVRQHLQGAID